MVFYCHINSVHNALADRFDELSLKSGRRHSSLVTVRCSLTKTRPVLNRRHELADKLDNQASRGSSRQQ